MPIMPEPTAMAIIAELKRAIERLEQTRERPPVAEEPDVILRTAEAAALLRIGQARLLQLAHAGKLPAYRQGRRFLFSRRLLLEAFYAHSLARPDSAQP